MAYILNKTVLLYPLRNMFKLTVKHTVIGHQGHDYTLLCIVIFIFNFAFERMVN